MSASGATGTALELLALDENGKRVLASPNVGLVRLRVCEGDLLGAGQVVGELDQLARRWPLRVPAEVSGRVRGLADARTWQPAQFGQTLIRLEPLEVSDAAREELAAAAEEKGTENAILATQSGRFYSRAAPEEPPFCSPGDEIAPGATIGLLEVMKTFTQVRHPKDASPVRFDAYAVADGAEVRKGDVVARWRVE